MSPAAPSAWPWAVHQHVHQLGRGAELLAQVRADGVDDEVGVAIAVGLDECGAVDPLGHHHDVVLMAMPLGRWYHWTKF